MRFDQKHSRNDEPQNDFPDRADLQALAEQLRDDAQFLSARYPAKSPTSLSPPGSRRAIALAIRVSAAVLLISLGIWTIGANRTLREPHQAAIPPAAPPVAHLDERDAENRRAAPAAIQMVPANWFQTLDGPEKEAVLDLLENRLLAQSSLSI